MIDSTMRQHDQAQSKTDIMAIANKQARTMLYQYLENLPFEKKSSDNLMSWTTGLFFAIQYAVWRQNKSNSHDNQIRLCMVETSSFPPGRFAHDLWFFEHFISAGDELDKQVEEFFKVWPL